MKNNNEINIVKIEHQISIIKKRLNVINNSIEDFKIILYDTINFIHLLHKDLKELENKTK